MVKKYVAILARRKEVWRGEVKELRVGFRDLVRGNGAMERRVVEMLERLLGKKKKERKRVALEDLKGIKMECENGEMG